MVKSILLKAGLGILVLYVSACTASTTEIPGRSPEYDVLESRVISLESREQFDISDFLRKKEFEGFKSEVGDDLVRIKSETGLISDDFQAISEDNRNQYGQIEENSLGIASIEKRLTLLEERLGLMEIELDKMSDPGEETLATKKIALGNAKAIEGYVSKQEKYESKISMLEQRLLKLENQVSNVVIASESGDSSQDTRGRMTDSSSDSVPLEGGAGADGGSGILTVPGNGALVGTEEDGHPPAEREAVDDAPVLSSEEKLFLNGEEAYKSGDYTTALGYFEEYVNLYGDGGNRDDSLFYLGSIYFSRGEYMIAVEEFAKVVTEMPESNVFNDSIWLLAVSFDRTGNSEEAGKYYKIIAENDDSPHQKKAQGQLNP